MAKKPRKRILILRSELLLNSGVQNILLRQKSLKVVGLEAKDQHLLFKHLEKVRPDVIITDDEFLTSHLASLLIYIQKYPAVRTIIMNLSESQIQIFDIKQIDVHSIDDFLEQL